MTPAPAVAAPTSAQDLQPRDSQLPQRRPAAVDTVDAEDDEEVSQPRPQNHAHPPARATKPVRARSQAFDEKCAEASRGDWGESPLCNAGRRAPATFLHTFNRSAGMPGPEKPKRRYYSIGPALWAAVG